MASEDRISLVWATFMVLVLDNFGIIFGNNLLYYFLMDISE